MDPTHRERATELLPASPELEHDQAQGALASNFSAAAVEAPQALLDDVSLPLFGAAGAPVCEQAHALADSARRAARLLRAMPVRVCRRRPG